MNDIKKSLLNWLDEFEGFKFPSYEKFPDIDLYMDQVVTYLERNLQALSTSSLDKVVTSSMINNYVKGEVVTAPIAKKYNKEHLALIEETCSLKQVLSIAEIKQILDVQYKDTDKGESFNSFRDLHSGEIDKSVAGVKKALKDIDENSDDIEALTSLALSLAVSANATITIAKRILFYIKKKQDMEKIKLEEAKRIEEEEKLKKEKEDKEKKKEK